MVVNICQEYVVCIGGCIHKAMEVYCRIMFTTTFTCIVTAECVGARLADIWQGRQHPIPVHSIPGKLLEESSKNLHAICYCEPRMTCKFQFATTLQSGPGLSDSSLLSSQSLTANG